MLTLLFRLLGCLKLPIFMIFVTYVYHGVLRNTVQLFQKQALIGTSYEYSNDVFIFNSEICN